MFFIQARHPADLKQVSTPDHEPAARGVLDGDFIAAVNVAGLRFLRGPKYHAKPQASFCAWLDHLICLLCYRFVFVREAQDVTQSRIPIRTMFQIVLVVKNILSGTAHDDYWKRKLKIVDGRV